MSNPRALAVALLLAGVCSAGAEMRTWTSTKGATVEAEMVRSDGVNVFLKKADGQLMRIQLQFLVEADQAYVSEQMSPTGTPGAPSITMPSLPGARPSVSSKDVLTDEQLANLKSEIMLDEDTKVILSVGFGPKALTPAQRKRLKPDDPVEYRIVADFLKQKKGNDGKWKSDRLSGSAKFYLLDAKGELLMSKSASLAKLCPT